MSLIRTQRAADGAGNARDQIRQDLPVVERALARLEAFLAKERVNPDFPDFAEVVTGMIDTTIDELAYLRTRKPKTGFSVRRTWHFGPDGRRSNDMDLSVRVAVSD